MEDYKKKYEMALEKAKTLLSKCKRVSDKASMIYRAEDIESMFPEFQKSEEEKIREEMLQIAKESEDSFYMVLTPNKRKTLINWLEKQNKQNSNILWHDISEEPEEQREIFCKWKGSDIDAVWHDVAFYHADTKTFWDGEHQIEDVIKWAYIDEMIEEQPQLYFKPKFKVGDWVAINPELRFASPLYIKDIDKSNYRVESLDGNSGTPTIDYLDNHYHLWTIEDAKDGDVLSINNRIIAVFKKLCNASYFHSYCYVDEDKEFIMSSDKTPNCWRSDGFYPATIEQHELLFRKMKEEGYQWDKNKKELIKL